MTSSIDILEQYVEGKDQDKHQILESIYADDALVHFELRTERIDFPAEISGRFEIARVLATDFNKKFTNVKTYYLSKPDAAQRSIKGQKWLVIMKDMQRDITRVGTGCYDWELKHSGNRLRVQSHKIYIHEMLELPDPGSLVLTILQSNLRYPFVEKDPALKLIARFPELEGIREYLQDSAG